MVMNEAIRLISNSIVTWATTKVRIIAYTGSSLFVLPPLKKESPGTKLSRAMAWSSFAEPMTPIREEKKDDANSPRRTTTLDILVCRHQDWTVGEGRVRALTI